MLKTQHFQCSCDIHVARQLSRFVPLLCAGCRAFASGADLLQIGLIDISSRAVRVDITYMGVLIYVCAPETVYVGVPIIRHRQGSVDRFSILIILFVVSFFMSPHLFFLAPA